MVRCKYRGSLLFALLAPADTWLLRSPQIREVQRQDGERARERQDKGREWWTQERAKAETVVKEKQAAKRLDVGGAQWSKVRIFHLYPV